jgi:hypothetical protein
MYHKFIPLMAEKYSIVCIYSVFFIHSFWFLRIVPVCTLDDLFESLFSILFNVYQGGELLGHMVILCLTLKKKFTFLLCWVGLYCDTYKSSHNILNISYLNLPLHHSPLFHPPLLPGVVSTDIFPFTYMCKQYLHHIHAPLPFPHVFPLPPILTSPGRIYSVLLFSNFV